MPAQISSAGIEVGFCTNDPEPMKTFYGEFLGLPFQMELAFEGGRQWRYQAGKSLVKVVVYDEGCAQGPVSGGGHTQAGIRYISLFVDNLLELEEEIKASPYTLLEPVTRFTPEIGFLFVEDPDGNWVEIAGHLPPEQGDDSMG